MCTFTFDGNVEARSEIVGHINNCHSETFYDNLLRGFVKKHNSENHHGKIRVPKTSHDFRKMMSAIPMSPVHVKALNSGAGAPILHEMFAQSSLLFSPLLSSRSRSRSTLADRRQKWR
jgi:hypothetical protein